MPTRVPWEPDFVVGHEVIDTQHQALLAQCNRLADHCLAGPGEDIDARFDQDLALLKHLAREHFQAETAVLAAAAYPDLEDHQADCEEFDYLADEVATTGHFDRIELQRFLALWCVGHVRGTAPRQRDWLAGRRPPA